MCGIAGLISRSPLTPEEVERVRAVNESLRHRGPDGAGEFSAPHLFLAMRRLSIIDLQTGWQPLYNEDRSFALVANGEIYNFVELRRQLEAKGHRFSTHSDCETIVHSYEEYGLEFVHHLRGMFAFALWDGRRQRLVLARDRLGEKPLYLYERNGQLLFASEMKALLRSGLVPFDLDPVAIDLYFHYQYVPEPRTPIKGVRKLDAACLLTVDVSPWGVAEQTYWQMEEAPPLEGDPASLIREELERISEMIIRADVPVGVALSGGLDSSAIAALAAPKYPGTMHAFSVGYLGRPENDERGDAQALADHLKMPFHEVEISPDEIVAVFPELVYWRDDPIADISGHGYYAVMKLAAEHGVPVMLQGQGGDELFWGYDWVRQAAVKSRQKAALLQKGGRALPAYLSFEAPKWFGPRTLLNWAVRGFGVANGWERLQRDRQTPKGQMVFYDLAPDFRMAESNTRTYYTSEFADSVQAFHAADLFTFPQPWPPVELRLTRLICDTYLRVNGIVQGDRLSMASSVELRLPLVDYRLVEAVIGLRKTQPDLYLPPKAWLKDALRGLLPEWVVARPKKGFAPPIRQWHEALFKAHGALLSDGFLATTGILAPEGSRQLAAGPFPDGAVAPLSFKALVLELWCRRMSEQKAPPAGAERQDQP